MRGRRICITEEQENIIYNYWLKSGASSKQIIEKFPDIISSTQAVSRILSKAIMKKKYLSEKK
jgi:hypothetical protein